MKVYQASQMAAFEAARCGINCPAHHRATDDLDWIPVRAKLAVSYWDCTPGSTPSKAYTTLPQDLNKMGRSIRL